MLWFLFKFYFSVRIANKHIRVVVPGLSLIPERAIDVVSSACESAISGQADSD